MNKIRLLLSLSLAILAGSLVGVRMEGVRGGGLNFIETGSSNTASSNPPGCTDGVDCVCDTVASTLPQGTSVLLCEDFDAPVLYSSLADGNWVDSSGCGDTERGACQYWTSTYSTGVNGSLWNSGQPNASPRIGPTCVITGGARCNGHKEWCSVRQGNEVDGKGRDCWEANSFNPHIDIVKYDEDFYDEVSTLTPPKKPNSSEDGVIAGNHAAARRIEAGGTNALGSGSRASWTASSTLGVAMLLAYASNVEQSKILNYPWKHNEWGSGQHGYFLFSSKNIGNDGTGPSDFPLQQFAITQANTQDQCFADTWTVGLYDPAGPIGVKFCEDTQNRYRWYADPTRYNRDTDWADLNEWRCIRAKITGLGTTNTCYTMWYNDGTTEKIVIDFCGMDSTFWSNTIPTYLYWNSYANANSGQGAIPTTVTTYRYEDSIVITDGDPPSCAAIGF